MQPSTRGLPIVAGGERRIYDVRAINVGGGSAGIAIDASEADALRAALVRMADAHRRTLDQLSSGVAVFDGQRRLAFYNDSYRRLWDLDRPSSTAIPTIPACSTGCAPRASCRSRPDFRAWKAKLHEAYRAVEPAKDTWYLPDGRALSVVTTPNPEGGVTYLFDDVTESLDLARRFDRLIRVQRETLDNLAEGGRGVRQQRPRAIVQSGLREDVEAVAGGAARTSRISRPWKPGASRCSTTPIPGGRIREAITGSTTATGAAEARAQGRQRARLHDHAAARRRHHADVPGHHRHRKCRAGAARDATRRCEAADQMKVDFVHHVSYELRSPLTTIIGFAHFLSDPSTGPLMPKQAEYLDYITASTNALLAIINNILDLATIDAGAMTLELGPVDIRKTIDAAAEGIQDRLATDRIELKVDADPDIGSFVGDERRVVQVLYNLLANAVGFSPQDSADHHQRQAHRTHVVFTVTDSGPGIPPDVKDKVFDWFESHSNGSRHRGAGLGLSLVRSFVELHGGKVRVDSIVGKGTTVTCDFPIDQAAHRNAAE